MKFDQFVHPELLLGKRGDKIGIECLKTAIALIRRENDRLLIEAASPIEKEIAHLLKKDSVFLRFTVLCKIFKESNSPVYHLGRDFAQALQKIDRAIPVEILPEKFMAYFSFSENSIFDDDGPVEGGYVCIDRGANLGMREEFASKRILSLGYVSKSNQPLGPIGTLTVPLEGNTITELANGVIVEDYRYTNKEVDYQKRHDVFRALVNSVIYLFSESAEIEKSLPFKHTGLSSNELKRRNKIINLASIPIVFLNRNYRNTRMYSVDSTWIDSFPRWQRCGPENSRVKLVFVSSHERRYKKAESDLSEQPESPNL
jgi:hypothetical protein